MAGAAGLGRGAGARNAKGGNATLTFGEGVIASASSLARTLGKVLGGACGLAADAAWLCL